MSQQLQENSTKRKPNNDFRPLGMPNTIDRLVDGSIAAYVMHHTAHLMHPSQAGMSYFKEPQKAVSCIQHGPSDSGTLHLAPGS